jgi:UDP-3-O-[3-hydroxymyristoyl] glucosamine N-acyltransferase
MTADKTTNAHAQLAHLGSLFEKGLWTEVAAKGAARLQAAVDSGKAVLRGVAVIDLDEAEQRTGKPASQRIRASAVLGAAYIEEGATVGVRAVLGNGVHIRDHATIERDAVLEDGVGVGNYSTVREGAVIGAGSFISSCGVIVKAGVEVPPDTKIFDHSPNPSIYVESRWQ